MSDKDSFNTGLVFSYPKSNKSIELEVNAYQLNFREDDSVKKKTISTFISPHGIEFLTSENYPEGTILKINVSLPNFWNLKQNYVEYNHTEKPLSFRVLAKVIEHKEIGKKGKKRLTLVQTVNIDEIDCKVLEKFLEEQK